MKSKTVNRSLPPPVQCREGFFIPLQYPRQELLVALAHLVLLGRLRAASVMNFVLDREKFQKKYELWWRKYSPPRRGGGCALKRMSRSHRSGSDGVVRPAQRFAELTINRGFALSGSRFAPGAPASIKLSRLPSSQWLFVSLIFCWTREKC